MCCMENVFRVIKLAEGRKMFLMVKRIRFWRLLSWQYLYFVLTWLTYIKRKFCSSEFFFVFVQKRHTLE